MHVMWYTSVKKNKKLSWIVNPSLVFVNGTNSISVIEQCENLNDLFFVESETITLNEPDAFALVIFVVVVVL